MGEGKAVSAEQEVRYTCRRAEGAITVDGHLEEEAWSRAERSPRFGDQATGKRALFDTRAAMLWDDDHFYVGFWLEDRDVWSAQEEVLQDNSVEVFISGAGAYYELAINPLGTTSEKFFIWKD